MYQFFTDSSLINENDIYIQGSDYNHIKNVLRLRVGDVVSVSDGINRTEYRCHIEDFESDRVHLRLDFVKEADVELPVKVTLFQGLPKSDKMDMIVQKAVELGVYEIVPVETGRCVTKLDEKKKVSRVNRWNAISEAAAKQSRRAVVPRIHPVMTFDEAMRYASDITHKLLPYERSNALSSVVDILGAVRASEDIGIFIGPEGGFEEAEVEAAVKSGFSEVSLGKRILRTETAGMVVLSWLIYIFEIKRSL